jgi:DNA-binding protein HU-beta
MILRSLGGFSLGFGGVENARSTTLHAVPSRIAMPGERLSQCDRRWRSFKVVRGPFKTPLKIRVFAGFSMRYGDFQAESAKEQNMADAKPATVPLSKMAGELAEKHGMSKKDAAAFLGSFVEMTTKLLKKGNKIRITGLGILQVRHRPARMGRNPATGEPVQIKASKKVAFRASKELKEAV